MTATLDRPTTTRPSVWAKSLPTLASAASASHAATSTAYIADWLAILASDPERGGEFDRELEAYAGDLRRVEFLTEYQGAGFLLALWAYQNVGNPLVPVLVQQVDRRAKLRGVKHCRWRGDLPIADYDAPRYDEALRRVQIPNKHDRERER